MSTRFGLVPLYRSLARRSRFQLSAGYLLCTTLASTIYFLGSSRFLPGLTWGAALLNLVAVSLLFTVVTWYRTDQVVGDAAGAFGMGIVEVDADATVQSFTANDPVILSGRGFRYEVHLMPRGAVHPPLGAA